MNKGERIGSGSEKIIYNDALNSTDDFIKKRGERVYAELYRKEDVNSVKARYYLGKLINLLLPGFYPEVDQAGTEGLSGLKHFLRMQKLHQDEYHLSYKGVLSDEKRSWSVQQLENWIAEQDKALKHNEEFKVLKKLSLEYGLPLDDYEANFSLQTDGKLMVLDLPAGWYIEADENPSKPELIICFDKEKMQTAVKNFQGEQKDKCQQYFDKFIHFFEKYQENFYKHE
jgi:hypothetical protein